MDKVGEFSFCSRCLFVFENCKDISGNPESSLYVQNFIQLKKDKIENKYDCNFCYGFLSTEIEERILKFTSELKESYEFSDYKLTTNFSPLFQLLHNFLKLRIKSEELDFVKSEWVNLLDVSLIRKVLKPSVIPLMSKLLDKPHDQKSKFEVRLILEFDQSFYTKIYKAYNYLPFFQKMKESDFNAVKMNERGAISDFTRSCSSGLFESVFKSEKLTSFVKLDFKIEVVNDNLFIKGNYLKFNRDIGQTPWEVDGQRICLSSVEEEMKKTLKIAFKSDDCILHAGGREDRDVRMLNSGRPFLLEIFNPRKISEPLKDMRALEHLVNSSTTMIQLKDLEISDKNYLMVLKKYEDSKRKLYTCVAWLSREITEEDIEKINNVKELDIIQKTPLRVLHRRALMDRKKHIYSLKASKINENFMTVDVLASAGTYIKEFIHGDLGRTLPNLGTILNAECDILQLDVKDIIWDN